MTRMRTVCFASPRYRRPRGTILILLLLLLPALIVLIGFSIDVAHMQRVRTELRATADLAAKAAADVLSETQDLDQARLAAQQIALENEVNSEPLQLASGDIIFGRSERQSDGTWLFTAWDEPYNSVQVNAVRNENSLDGPVPLFFGQFYGHPNFHPVVASTATFVDVDISLVLDRSSSMKLAVDNWNGLMSTSDPRFCDSPWEDSRWVALQSAVQIFLDRLGATATDEQVGIVTFSSNYNSKYGDVNLAATIDQVLTSNMASPSAAMEERTNTVWNGMTEINSGIKLGNQQLTGAGSRPFADKIMIVFTDGVYTNTHPRSEAEKAAANGVRIHTITFGNGANQEDMQEIAAIGGGQHFHAPDVETLEKVFEQLAASIAFLSQ